jgi:hypothetical protein
MERVGADRRLSAEGRADATRDLLKKAIRDLRDIQTPLKEHRAKTEEMRATVKRPAFDKTDIAAALARREIRDVSRAMTSGQRAAKLAGPTRSIAFVDALLEFEDDPWMAGVDVFNPNELEIYEIAKQERLRDLHGPPSVYNLTMDPYEKYDMMFNGAVATRNPTSSPGRYAGMDNGWVGSLLGILQTEFNKSIVQYPSIERAPGGASTDENPNLQNPKNPLPYDPMKLPKTVGAN